MKKSFVILLNFGYWLIYFLLLLLIFFIAESQNRKISFNVRSLLPLFSLILIPNLISFYTFYFFLFPKFLARRKIVLLVIFGTIVCLFSTFSGAFISLIEFGFEQAIFANLNEFFSVTLFYSVLAAIHGGIALVIRGFITWYDEIKLKEELTAKNFEMESALIKSQINPHFLFNTLNNIDFLITKDASKASEYLNKLSDILRYMVYDTKDEKIALSKELAYIEKYLELQKIRTTNPDYVNFKVTGEAENLTVSPMIFFPFIENAFKHTENNKQKNKIEIKILIMDKDIYFDCENTYKKSSKIADYGGLGNQLIERRLMILYPAKHLLEITNNDGIYKVQLTLNEN